MLPFVRFDSLWRSGLAGAIPSAAAFVAAGTFLFAAVRRIFDSTAAAAAAVALFAGNPNVLYLQSTAMTEPLFFACLAALLYATVRFRQTQGWGAIAGAGVACGLAALTRYEGWFLIPFVTAYFLVAAKKQRMAQPPCLPSLRRWGPLYWLAHNWWMVGDALDFYRGPYSAQRHSRIGVPTRATAIGALPGFTSGRLWGCAPGRVSCGSDWPGCWRPAPGAPSGPCCC